MGTNCAKSVTIYIDLSGTMTRSVRGTPTPLNTIASTLESLLRSDGFLGPGDRVAIKYFGTVVRTAAETRDDSIGLLRQLAASAPAAPQELFTERTDFGKLFEDIRDRVQNASGERQIIAIASDLAHDNDVATATDAEKRNENFDSIVAANTAVTAILQPQNPSYGRVTIVAFKAPQSSQAAPTNQIRPAGTRAPPPQSASVDGEVAAHVETKLAGLGIRIRRYDEDPAEAARTLALQLAGTIGAAPISPGLASITTGNRVTFALTNTTCDPVTVVALRFDGIPAAIPIAPVRLEKEARVVTVNASDLDAIWNTTRKVEPVLEAGSVARTTQSEEFWLGDVIRIQSANPVVIERQRHDQTLLIVNGDLKIYAPGGSVTIRGVSGDASGRRFVLEPMIRKQVVFSFPLQPHTERSVAATAPGSISIAADGPRIIAAADETPTQQKNLTIGRDRQSKAGAALTTAELLIIALWALLFFATLARAAAGVSGQRFSRQVTGVVRRLIPVVVLPPFGYYVVSRDLGELFFEPIFGSPLLLAAILRGVTAFFLIGWLVRLNILKWIWGSLAERTFLPNEIAVERRLAADIAWLLIAGAVLLWVVLSVIWVDGSLKWDLFIVTGSSS